MVGRRSVFDTVWQRSCANESSVNVQDCADLYDFNRCNTMRKKKAEHH